MSAITKEPVRVGGAEETYNGTGLPMYRKFIGFDGGRESECIQVYYEQYLLAGTHKLEQCVKSYIVKDITEIGHWSSDEVPVWIIDIPAYPAFSDGWYFKKISAKNDGLYVGGIKIAPVDYELNFGKDLIVSVIDQTLIALDFDIQNGYITQP